MRRFFYLLVATILVGSFASAEQAKATQPTKAQKSKKQDRDEFVLTTITGKKLKVYGTNKGLEIPAYKGKVVMVEFWGTHCPPCRASIPHYIDIIKKYGKNVALLAVEAQNTSKSSLINFVKSKGINYDVVSTEDGALFMDYVSQRAKWRGSIPFLMIVNKKGEVVTMQVGMVPESAIVKVLKQLIAQK
jgi:thiol-disulfide isomerase/thioredoxin